VDRNAPIRSGFLQRQDAYREVSLLDLSTLLFHLHFGARNERVGFEDAERTLAQVSAKLSHKVRVEKAVLESALWSSNLCDEIGKFVHPQGISFDEWMKQMFGTEKFNRAYNLLEKK
jgi:hypothetical protein